MGTSSEERGASTRWNSRPYKLVSARYRDKIYPDGILFIDEARNEIELRQWTGRRKKKQAAIARFRLEPTVEVLVDGPLLSVSELSVSLESPAEAAEVADILRRPARERESVQALSEAESALREFLLSREQAVTFLSRMKVNPREALLDAESLWAADDKNEPLEAVYSSYSGRLADALEKMKSSLAGTEKRLGPGVTERLYALAYAVGAVQNALLDGDFRQDKELAALQELGVAATAQELRMEKPTERLLLRAHPVLVGITAAHAPRG